MKTPGWEKRLHHEIEAAREKPFQWGTHDCCMWVAHMIKILSGRELGQAFRGQYHDQAGAHALIDQHWDGSLTELVSSFLGEAKAVAYACRGDVVLYDSDNMTGLGICVDHRAAFLHPEKGLALVKISRCAKAWSVS